MATAVKRPRAEEDDVKKAPTVGDVEKEALGPKKPKTDKKDKKEEKKEKTAPKGVGKLEIAVLISLLWLAIFSAFVLLVIFDPTEDRVIRGLTLMLLNPEDDTREEIWAGDTYYYQDWERELDERAKALDAFEDSLNLREEELDNLESEVSDKQDEVDSMLEALRESGATVGVVQPDPAKVAKNLALMPAATAASSLEGMDIDTAILLCTMIADKKLAPILDAMDPDVRIEILETLGTPAEVEEDW